jgi:hypothetical protein
MTMRRSGRPIAPSLISPTQLSRRPQRLRLAVNLLLVLALGILVGTAASQMQEAASTASTQPTNTASTAAASTGVATPPKIKTQVPQACLDAQELADEVISRLDRNDRDQRLFSALRDYTIASQACRRAASP